MFEEANTIDEVRAEARREIDRLKEEAIRKIEATRK